MPETGASAKSDCTACGAKGVNAKGQVSFDSFEWRRQARMHTGADREETEADTLFHRRRHKDSQVHTQVHTHTHTHTHKRKRKRKRKCKRTHICMAVRGIFHLI
jgi:hypothetical protein